MALFIKRHQKYRGHFASAVPRHFVCACCGSRVVEQWHADGSLIMCGINKRHNEGILPENDWLAIHPQRIESETFAIDDAIALDKEVEKVVKEYRRRRRQQAKKVLYGEDNNEST